MPSSYIIAQVVCFGDKMVPGHYKLTSFECATILSAALQLFAIKLPLHLNTNSFQNSKLKLSALKVIFRTSPSIKCPITPEIICTTSVSFSSAKPVQAFARRKSPLSTAILLPNSISSWYDLLDDDMLDRFTIPVCTKLAEIEKKALSQRKNSLCALVLSLLHHSYKGLCSWGGLQYKKDGGCSSYLLGVKMVVLVPLWVSSLERSKAGG